MRQKIFWLLGSLLALFAITSRAEDELADSKNFAKIVSERELKFVDTKNSQREEMSMKREIDWSGREIDADKDGCWRYCVRKRIYEGITGNNDSIKRVNVIWNIVNEARVTLTGKTSSWGIFSGHDKDTRWESSTISSEKSNIFYGDDPGCELYLELGCKSFVESNSNISTIPDEFSNSDQKKLVSKNDAVGFSSTGFRVDEVIEKLTILAFGKLSQAVLEIPIARRESDSVDSRRTTPVFSLSRTSGAKGVIIDASNPPSGGWRLNLLGMENSNYNFSITAVSSKKIVDNSNEKNDSTRARSLTSDELDSHPSAILSRSQRLAYPRTNYDNYSAQEIKSDDEKESSMPKGPSARALTLKTNETEFSRIVNLEAELMERENESGMNDEDIDKNAKILQDSEFNEFSSVIEDTWRKRKTILDLSPSTELILRPTITPFLYDIVFTVTNNQDFGRRHTFQGSSKLFSYIGVIPNAFWIGAGETINVAVRIQVPNIEYTEPGTVTLYARRNEDFEVVEKSAYIYVQGSSGAIETDSYKPSIDYSFNDNCAGKLNRDRCARSRWSVEITVRDSDSGLKRVISVPNGMQPRSDFISGTKNSIIFYYSSTCCYTAVDVTAIDAQGNSNTRTIDVTAWDNLTQGEIAAIIVGTLLILLLIVFIILVIIYCVRKRKSHDLSYSQRYGSRTPASAERTNF